MTNILTNLVKRSAVHIYLFQLSFITIFHEGADICIQSSSLACKELHVFDLPGTRSGIAIQVHRIIPEPDGNRILSDGIGCHARIAAEILVSLHGCPFG